MRRHGGAEPLVRQPKAYLPTAALPVILCTADAYAIADEEAFLRAHHVGGDPQTIRHYCVGPTGSSDAGGNGDIHCVGALPSPCAGPCVLSGEKNAWLWREAGARRSYLGKHFSLPDVQQVEEGTGPIVLSAH